ncbi:MAG TPA: PP2C family serine/threonine-protein phosphatase [Candidatus Limnocylindrales bacterium]|nr:PP2C family serine/threonine-protein phosphatase [Candidatus Limnocylindrales bacterium]
MIAAYGLTDVGKRRSLNEDSILVDENLFVVCDGMGGHKAGEVASQLALESIARFIGRSNEDDEITWPYGFQTRSSLEANRLRTAIKLANRAVSRKAASSDDYTGMGTTATVALIAPNRPYVTYANVGDSRLYLLHQGTITQLSRDDSWANLPWGADKVDVTVAVNMKHVLTKALGAQDDVDFDVNTQELADGDILLLCSDGLTNMLSDEQILAIVTSNASDLNAACQQLIAAANEAGGRDNISAILVRYSA